MQAAIYTSKVVKGLIKIVEETSSRNCQTLSECYTVRIIALDKVKEIR